MVAGDECAVGGVYEHGQRGLTDDEAEAALTLTERATPWRAELESLSDWAGRRRSVAQASKSAMDRPPGR